MWRVNAACSTAPPCHPSSEPGHPGRGVGGQGLPVRGSCSRSGVPRALGGRAVTQSLTHPEEAMIRATMPGYRRCTALYCPEMGEWVGRGGSEPCGQ